MNKEGTIEDLGITLGRLQSQMKTVVRETGYAEFGELNIPVTTGDPNDYFLRDEYARVLNQLQSIVNVLDYLKKPIKDEGVLYRKANGRYEFNDFHELTSGSTVEFLYYDQFQECEKWSVARIEHSGDYYLSGYSRVPLEGLRVRIR